MPRRSAARARAAEALESARATLRRRPGAEARVRAYAEIDRAAGALGATSEAAEAWLALALDAWSHGHRAIAERAAGAALQLAEALDDARLVARAHMEIARVAFGRSDWAAARAHTERARDLVVGADPALEAAAHIGLAAIGSHELAPDAPRHARRAIFLAEELGDAALLGRALAQLGIVLVERGVREEGRAVLERAIAIERRRRAGEHECRGLLYLAMLELDAGRPLQSMRHLSTARALAERHGARATRGLVIGSIGVVHLVRGTPAAAARDLVRADLLLEDLGNRHARITFAAFLGAAEALAARPTEARAAFELAHHLLREGDAPAYAGELVRTMEQVLAITEGAPLDGVRAVLAEIERGEIVRHWADLRVGCAVLRRVLLGEGSARVPRAEAIAGLVLGPEARWFSLEGGAPVELERKPVLRRALTVLAEARARTPGKTVARSQLARAIWPHDARLSALLLANRVNVAIATLRRLGLRDAIVTGREGYRLREDLAVIVDPGTP